MDYYLETTKAFWLKTKNVVVNSSWIIFGKVLIFGLGFAFVTGLANLIPAHVIGQYNFILAVFTIIGITNLSGMESALVRAVARGFEGSLKSMTRIRFIYGLIGSVICFGLGVIYLIKGVPTIGYTFMAVSPFIPLYSTYNDMTYSFFQGRKNFKKSILLAVLCQAFFSIPTLLVLFLTHNLIIITVSFFVFQALGSFVIYQLTDPQNNHRDYESEKFGFHLTAIEAPRIIAGNIDTVIVFMVAGPVAAAIYTFAFTPMGKLEQLIPIDILSLPELSKQSPTYETKKKLFAQTFLLVLIMIPIIIIGWLTAPFVFHILFHKFPESVALFRILIISLLTTPFMLLKTSFIAWHKKKQLTINETAAPLLRIGLMVALGFPFGALGVVVGVIIARFIEAGILSGLFIRLTNQQHHP